VELPEVEVMRRDLEKDVVGRRVKTAEVKSSRNAMRVIRRHGKRKEFTSRLEGRKLSKVERRGKYLLVHLDSGDVLVTHFGMSGQFQRGNGRVAIEPHTHVILTFQQGGDLRFIDPRTFGEMFVSSADEIGKVKELQHIAIDPLDQVFTWPTFQYLLAERGAKMKQLLMDQKFISGLGNIYSDEVLFAAGLRYDRVSDTLSSQEVRRLYRAIQETIQEAIKLRGTTLGDEAYVDLFGKPGEYQGELKVYGREGEPCRRCRSPIETVKVSQRTSYFCPQCQS
jgi:formamidopyrimidine-DNA glycosylase